MNPEDERFALTRHSLIERLKNLDDSQSWKDFFDTYWRLIYGAALKSGLTHDEAEEVVQNTIISVTKYIGKFKTDPSVGSFKGWLLTITRSRIADQFRKRPPEWGARAHRRNEEADSAVTPTEERIPDPAGNFLDSVWDQDWRENLLNAALEKVKTRIRPQHFQIFYQAKLKNIAPEQVAKFYGVALGSVYSIMSRVQRLVDKEIETLEKRNV